MNIKEQIENADMVLVGIGETFQEKFEQISNTEQERVKSLDLNIEMKKKDYLDKLDSDDVIKAYNQLSELLIDQNYFVVSLCNDDKIFKTSLQKDRIVAPCGTYSLLQCENGCKNILYTTDEVNDISSITCHECGGKLCYNLVSAKVYNENGYLPMWEKYTKWVQGTLNKKVCIIELGVGFQYPSVIRWPFEKIAYFNQKANFIRVHESLYQLSDELKDKGIGIKENPIELLLNSGSSK